jgi:hypothetical protein
MGTMADAELGFARLTAVLGPCAHPDAVPVELAATLGTAQLAAAIEAARLIQLTIGPGDG